MKKAKRFPYEFFSVAADILVLRRQARKWLTLLIERKHAPYQGCWALPGGFLERDEDARAAALRELHEETGLVAKRLTEFGSFSAPNRDPRGRTVTIAYYAVLGAHQGEAVAGDDAGRAQWFPIGKLPPLAFDHAAMVAQGLKRFRHDQICRRLTRIGE